MKILPIWSVRILVCRKYFCTHTCANTHTHNHTHARTHAHTHTHTHRDTYTHVHSLFKWLKMHSNLCATGRNHCRFYVPTAWKKERKLWLSMLIQLYHFDPYSPNDSPWYNCTGWLGIKYQVTYLLQMSKWSCHYCKVISLWSFTPNEATVIVKLYHFDPSPQMKPPLL